MFPHFKVAKTAQITLYNKTSNAQTGNRFAQFAHVRIITELFGLEGTSWGQLAPSPSAQAGSARAGCPTQCPIGWVLRSLQPSSTTHSSVSRPPHSRKSVFLFHLVVRWNLMCLDLPHVLSLDTAEKSLPWPIGCFYILVRCPCDWSPEGWTAPYSSLSPFVRWSLSVTRSHVHSYHVQTHSKYNSVLPMQNGLLRWLKIFNNINFLLAQLSVSQQDVSTCLNISDKSNHISDYYLIK